MVSLVILTVARLSVLKFKIMKIHNFSGWAITFMLVLQFVSLNAQFSVDAGRGLIVCISAHGIQNEYSLGGSPTIRQGVAPFKIEWSANHTWAGMKFTASTFLNDTSISNPIISSEASFLGNNNMVKFYLKVTDVNQNVRFDSTIVRFSRFVSSGTGGSRFLPLGDSLRIYSGIGEDQRQGGAGQRRAALVRRRFDRRELAGPGAPRADQRTDRRQAPEPSAYPRGSRGRGGAAYAQA